MGRHPYSITNALIRKEIEQFIAEKLPGTEFSTDDLAAHIQQAIPKARINNRRIGVLLREYQPAQVERLGQIYPPLWPFDSREVFWRISKPCEGVA